MDILVWINGTLMINPLIVSSKNVKIGQKRCLGTSVESFTGSSLALCRSVHHLKMIYRDNFSIICLQVSVAISH